MDSKKYEEKTIAFTANLFRDIQQQLHTTKAEVGQLSNEVSELEKVVKQQQFEIQELQQKTGFQEILSKRNNF